MMLWSIWWVWVAAALILGIIEIFVPLFVFLGMALGALLIGLGLGFGVLGLAGIGLPALLATFAAVSIAATIVLRRVLGVPKGQVKVWSRDINE